MLEVTNTYLRTPGVDAVVERPRNACGMRGSNVREIFTVDVNGMSCLSTIPLNMLLCLVWGRFAVFLALVGFLLSGMAAGSAPVW